MSNMSEEELATVVAIDGNHAWVGVVSGDPLRSGCHQQSSRDRHRRQGSLSMKAQRLRVALTGDVAGGPADPAWHPQASILRGAALVYVLPLFCLLLGLLGQFGWCRSCRRERVTILLLSAGGAIGFYWSLLF